jgi:predicted transcriptional regulator
LNAAELAVKLEGHIITGEEKNYVQITGAYCCDLLSWVMSHAGKGSAWITVHTHLNIVAVASLAELSCIIIPEGITVEEAVAKKAAQEGIPVICTKHNAYEICCIIHDCGL